MKPQNNFRHIINENEKQREQKGEIFSHPLCIEGEGGFH